MYSLLDLLALIFRPRRIKGDIHNVPNASAMITIRTKVVIVRSDREIATIDCFAGEKPPFTNVV